MSTFHRVSGVRRTKSNRRRAAIVLGAAACLSVGAVRAQTFNIVDLGAQFGAPIGMEGNSGSLLLPDATTGQVYGFAPPVGGYQYSTFPTPTPLDQLANGNSSSNTPYSYSPTTPTYVTAIDAGSSQAPDASSSRLAGSFTANDGTTHAFVYYNFIFDGKSPPTQGNSTSFQDIGSLPGHTHDTLTVTSVDMFNNIVGYATSSTGTKTPFIKRIGGSAISVLTGTPMQEATGVLNGRVVGNTVVAGVSHGYYNGTDIGTLGGQGTRANGIGGSYTIVGTSMTAGGYDHAFYSTVINFNTASEAPGPLVDLGTLGGNNSFGNAISPYSDTVVGFAQTASGASHAFESNGNSIIDLNTLLSPQDQARWVLQDATTIDSQGDIGGIGLLNGVQHPFFLTTQNVIQPPVSATVQTVAPSRVLQQNGSTSLIVPLTVNVQLGSDPSTPVNYTVTAAGSPTATFTESGTNVTKPATLTTAAQVDSHAAQVDLTRFTGANYNGTLTFSAPGSGVSDTGSLYSIQVLDPATINAGTNADAKGNLTQVFVTKAANGNPDRQAADAEVTGDPFIAGGFSQVGSALSDGATITDAAGITANFTFDTTHAINGLHNGYVVFNLQNDHTLLGAQANDLGQVIAYLAYTVDNPALPKGSSYAGLTNASPFNYGTQATLLDGSVGNNPGAKAGSGNGKPTINFSYTANPDLASDVVTLTGTNGDVVTLQLSFSPAASADPAGYVLRWDPTGSAFAATDGVLAVAGNDYTGITDPLAGTHFVLGAYDPSVDFHLGWYGVDPTNDVAWAVIDHNSDFAVALASVPEPVSVVGLAGVIVLGLRRRRRRLI